MKVGDKVRNVVLVPKGNFNPTLLPNKSEGVIVRPDSIRDWMVKFDNFELPFRSDELEVVGKA